MISLSSEFSRKMKRFCSDKKQEDYLFDVSQVGYNNLLKRQLEKLGVKKPNEFSSHNIRKTHGMYLKALGIDIGEICTRLGHDYNTYIGHYGSADIFGDKDIREIKELLGDLHSRMRRF
jgi:integrase